VENVNKSDQVAHTETKALRISVGRGQWMWLQPGDKVCSGRRGMMKRMLPRAYQRYEIRTMASSYDTFVQIRTKYLPWVEAAPPQDAQWRSWAGFYSPLGWAFLVRTIYMNHLYRHAWLP
jgi:hypothetical protein